MDHDPRNPAYIATQGPLPHTVADFWQVGMTTHCVVAHFEDSRLLFKCFGHTLPISCISEKETLSLIPQSTLCPKISDTPTDKLV